MRKFILSILSFIPLAVLIYLLGMITWGSYQPDSIISNLNYKMGSLGHMNTRLKELKNYKNVDLLFLGSSHVYRGFDTRIFENHGYKAFNLGSSAQTPIQSYFLLENYLDSLNPGLVIIDVSPGGFSNDGVESTLDLIANRRIDYSTFKMVLEINHLKTYNTLIFGLYRQLLHLDDDFKEPLITNEDQYIPGGFVEKSLQFNHDTIHAMTNWMMDKKQLLAFDHALHFMKDRNVPYLLVQVPITPGYYKAHKNNPAIDDFFKSNGDYMNFNELITLNDTLDFYDRHHLNMNGVKKFDEAFLYYLDTYLTTSMGRITSR